jgi:hypothetical protein
MELDLLLPSLSVSIKPVIILVIPWFVTLALYYKRYFAVAGYIILFDPF